MTKKSKNPCLTCDCWDSDAEGCTMPHSDKWYACPNDNENSIDPKILEEIKQMIDEVLFIEKLNSKWGKKVD